MIEVELPWPSLFPFLQGILVGVVLLLGFALPPLLNLRSVPALRVLRRDIGNSNAHSLTGYALGLAVLSVLFLWKAGDVRFGIFSHDWIYCRNSNFWFTWILFGKNHFKCA